MHMPPDMVLFDCDGVVVDSEPITINALCQNLAGYGLVIEDAEANDLFVGGTMMGVMDEARRRGADLPEDWLDEIYDRILIALDRDVTLIPGIAGVLDVLETHGVPFAIGSNGPHVKMDVTLRKTGIMERFAGRVYSREDVPSPKPAPDVYLKAAADAGIPASRCVVVEDSPSGARAGKAAGMYTIGYVADTPAAKLEAICDALILDMTELPVRVGLMSS